MAKRTIKHALFRYTGPSGEREVAFRGQTVDITNERDLARGDEHGAFTDTVGELTDQPGSLDDITVDSTDAEIDAFVKSAKVGEVSALLSAHPELADRVLDAETRVSDGDPRPGVVKAAEAAAGAAG